jgi:hypothetical protein
MNLLTISDVRKMVSSGEKTALVLKWEGCTDTCSYWPAELLQELEQQAQKKVSDGEFDTLDEAMQHIEKIAYICTEIDFNNEQEQIRQETSNDTPETFSTLQELTGQESGIVIYGSSEAVVCNWSSVRGYPRVDPLGLTVLGFGEEIPNIEPKQCTSIPELMEGVNIIFANGENMPTSGRVYELPNDIKVIAPDGWC